MLCFRVAATAARKPIAAKQIQPNFVYFAATRWFSDDSSTFTPPSFEDNVRLNPELLERASARDKAIRIDHNRLNTSFPAASQAPSAEGRVASEDEIRRKRLVYRSKQRGWLEVDLLMGTWASENVHTLSMKEMDEYEAILNQETMDIFAFVTGKKDPPPELRGPLLERLRTWAASKPLGTASPEAYAKAKHDSNMT